MEPQLTIGASCNLYTTEEACVRELFRIKWPDGYRCPICRHSQATVIRTRRLPLYQCKRCRYQTSLTAGTVMEKSKTSLRKWFLAMSWLAQGISARQLSDAIQVTYKTAWLIAHKIRHAIHLAESERLAGEVRVHEGRYGATSFASMFDRHARRHPLIAAASVTPAGALIRVKLHQVPPSHQWGNTVSKLGFEHFIGENVSAKANVQTAPGIYNAARHPLSMLWRAAARWMNETYFGLLPKHLQAYLDEYAYRHSLSSSDTQRAGSGAPSLLQACASHPALTYPQLTRRPA
ncbi:transposase [Cohnella lubricantis]|uniref:IS1595 family transposase n=1 Tax=Cohnella lubricantis TaxID=2163172 RepID=A0A841TBA3_9BACL|nr:transposase [Cohnella lubricantis]MBB6677376.1 IS1595 family transposase [Cohnella lubricantis]MBP2118734.1 transposase-like protein [Cohnella lubricantis]